MRIILLICFIISSSLFGQEFQKDNQTVPSRYGYEITRPAEVSFNYFIDRRGSDWSPLLYISVAIQNDFLQFTLNNEVFSSRYQVTVNVRKENSTLISKTWTGEAQLTDFDETNSRIDFQTNYYTIELDSSGLKEFTPGEYEIMLEVADLLSNRVYKNSRKLIIPGADYKKKNENISHTYIEFLANNTTGDEDPLQIATTRNSLEFNKPYKAIFRALAPQKEKLTFNARLYFKNEGDSLVDQQFIDAVKNEDGIFTVLYSLPYTIMDEGSFLLRFSVDDEDFKFEQERKFTNMWLTKPLYLFKIDLAIRPLKYLLSKEEMEKVDKMDMDAMTAWFNDFWKQRDPTPDTKFNELMNEYYNRVTDSVREYSTRFKEGWQTDQGKIFLLYGEPDEVENRKYALDKKPHILWRYNKKGEVLEFLFVDEFKNGEFTLVEQEPGQN